MKNISTFARRLITLAVLTVIAYEPGAFAATGTLHRPTCRLRPLSRQQAPPCTKATADALVDQYKLNVFLLARPAVQVLCGPFAGPDSKAMVVAIGAGTCWGAQGFPPVRSSAGDWKLAFDDYDWIILPLVAVGSAIEDGAGLSPHRPAVRPDRGYAGTYLGVGRPYAGGRPVAPGQQGDAAADHRRQYEAGGAMHCQSHHGDR